MACIKTADPIAVLLRPSAQLGKNVARDGDRVILVVLSIVACHFHVQESLGVFAENHGEICVAAGHRVEPLKIAAFGEPGNEFSALDRIDRNDQSGLDRNFEHRLSVAD